MSDKLAHIIGIIITMLISSAIMSVYLFFIKKHVDVDVGMVIFLTAMIAHGTSLKSMLYSKSVPLINTMTKN